MPDSHDSYVKSIWEVSHSGLFSENKEVLVCAPKTAKPQVTQPLCFCARSFSLSPSSVFPPSSLLCRCPYLMASPDKRGKLAADVFLRWKKLVCVCVCVRDSNRVYIPALRGGFQAGILQPLPLWFGQCAGVLCGAVYVRKSHDAQRSACQRFEAFQGLDVVGRQAHPAVWLTALMMTMMQRQTKTNNE